MLRRTGQSVVVLIGVSIIVFALVHLVPGDPVRLALGTRFSQESYDALQARSGLDQPLLQQYFGWAGRALTGDLGVSFRSGEPVTAQILERLPATLTLAFAAIVVALLIAVPLGTISALRPRSLVDRGATVLSQIGISVPDFWMGIVLILVFAGTLGWLPSGGYVPLTEDPWGWFQRLIMPAVVTGVVSGSVITRFVRSSVLEALGQDHVRTAQAKGLRSRQVLSWHVLRNALLPLVTVTGVQLAYLLSGVVVVEIVFSWPGLGQLALQAVQARDYPVLQGAVLLFALVFLLVNLMVDLLYSRLDPRIARR
ncbi:ABC transporter permease [Modestobacter sp. SYSU DS0985]